MESRSIERVIAMSFRATGGIVLSVAFLFLKGFTVEPLIAGYYRAMYFNNSETQEPLPASLTKLHIFTHRRCQWLALRVGKAEVMTTFYLWMAATGEGRKFASLHPDLAGLFSDPTDDPVEAAPVAPEAPAASVTKKPLPLNAAFRPWEKVAQGTEVEVTVDDKTVVGKFDSISAPWLKVVVPGSSKPKPFRPKQVKLATPASV